jgi:hypothetical protein
METSQQLQALTDTQRASLKESLSQNADGLYATIDAIEEGCRIDRRAAAIARTHLQTGFMWLARAIDEPGA